MLKFFTTSKYVLPAWGGIFVILAGVCLNSYILLLLNDWRGVFWGQIGDAMAQKNNISAADLYYQMVLFGCIVGPAVLLYSFNSWFVQRFCLRWRAAMTEYYVSHWDSVTHIEGVSQRVAEDTAKLTTLSETVGQRIAQAVVNAAAFIPVLITLSKSVPALPIIGYVPCSLLILALAWAGFGTVYMIIAGRKLPLTHVHNQKTEAALRKALVLAEGSGKPDVTLLWDTVIANSKLLYGRYGIFNLHRGVYLQADALVLPIVMVPAIIAGNIGLGLYQQISTAMGAVTDAFQTIVGSYTEIVEIVAVIHRLRAFDQALLKGE